MDGMRRGPGLTEAVIRAIPEEKLITETDSMARLNSRWGEFGKAGGPPAAGSGQEQSNGPVDVIKVAESIAKIRGVSTEEIGNIATRNLKRVLKV